MDPWQKKNTLKVLLVLIATLVVNLSTEKGK